MSDTIRPQHKARILGRLHRIAEATFDEETIALLLIDLRPFLSQDSLLRDLADFVAHPEQRDRGRSHSDVNLAAINIRQITSRIPMPVPVKELDTTLMALLLYGVDQVPQKQWNEISLWNKEESKVLVGRCYEKIDNTWRLRSGIAASDDRQLRAIQNAVFNSVFAECLISQASVIQQLTDAIGSLKIDRSQHYVEQIEQKQNDIMLCILCTLQQTEFVLYDKSTARLCWLTYEGARLSVFMEIHDLTKGVAVCLPLVASDVVVSDYWDGDLAAKENLTAERDSTGRLRLRCLTRRGHVSQRTPLTDDRCHRILVLLLRVGGGLACTAVFAIFLPTSWMAAIHRWLGLGEFPDAPITQYLARSVSAFYAVFGGLTVLASLDVRRFGSVISYLAAVTMAFGAVITGIDANAGMPTYWTLFEGPPTFVIGLAILLLNRRVQRDIDAAAADL